MNKMTLATASEIVGPPVVAGIWLHTRPLPWFSKTEGWGSVLGLVVLVTCACFQKLFPPPKTDTETRLSFSGPVYCARTDDELVVIASDTKAGNARMTTVLQRFSLSELSSFEIAAPSSSRVILPFNSGETFVFHFEGDLKDLTTIGLSEIVEENQAVLG